MTKPDYKNARKAASEILILQEKLLFPIDVEKIEIKDKNIIFSSYKDYALKANIDVSELSCSGMFKDAMVINYNDSKKVILYNSDISSKGRILWNKAHELGHIVLNHKYQGEKEEREADLFASQLLLPQCLLKSLMQRNVKVTKDYIVKNFGLSLAAANSCLKLLFSKLQNDYDDEYDDIILLKCNNFINDEINQSLGSRYDDDISDEQRNNWLNDL